MQTAGERPEIRPMRPDEIGLALDWAAAEGWNPGLHDAVPFAAEDPEGFLIGHLDGAPVAVISGVRYGADFAFLGFYIVRPDLRGRGYGLAIWQALMARLQGRLVGLDGVVAQQDNYRRSGFVPAHRNIRHEGRATAAGPVHPAIVTPGAAERAALPAWDRRFFPAPRAAFLAAWISRPGTVLRSYVADGRLQGYGVIRPCRTGFKIGPLFAERPAVAEALFQALTGAVPAGAPVFLDTPAITPEALALARRHGMTPVFETARMYTGPAPRIAIDRTYGLTSFELG